MERGKVIRAIKSARRLGEIPDLSGVDLRGVDLSGVDLRGANLLSANLERAVYDGLTIWPEGFDPASRGAINW